MAGEEDFLTRIGLEIDYQAAQADTEAFVSFVQGKIEELRANATRSEDNPNPINSEEAFAAISKIQVQLGAAIKEASATGAADMAANIQRALDLVSINIGEKVFGNAGQQRALNRLSDEFSASRGLTSAGTSLPSQRDRDASRLRSQANNATVDADIEQEQINQLAQERGISKALAARIKAAEAALKLENEIQAEGHDLIELNGELNAAVRVRVAEEKLIAEQLIAEQGALQLFAELSATEAANKAESGAIEANILAANAAYLENLAATKVASEVERVEVERRALAIASQATLSDGTKLTDARTQVALDKKAVALEDQLRLLTAQREEIEISLAGDRTLVDLKAQILVEQRALQRATREQTAAVEAAARLQSGETPTLFQRFGAAIRSRDGSPADPIAQATLSQTIGEGASRLARFLIPTAIFVGATQGIRAVLQESEALQQQFVTLRSQLDAVGEGQSFTHLADQIRVIARDTGVAASQVTAGVVKLTGAFGSADDAISNTDDAIKAAKLSGEDLNTTITKLSAAAVGFGLTGSTAFQQLSDEAVGLHQRFGVEIGESVDFLSLIAPVARSAGLSIKEIGAISAEAQASSGRSGAAIAEGFNRVLPAIQKNGLAILQLYNSIPDLQSKVPSIAQAIAGGNTGQIFLQLIRDYGSLSDANQKYVIQLLGGRREAQALLGVFDNSGRVIKELDRTTSDAGQTTDLFAKQQQTLRQEISRLAEALRQLGVGLFEGGIGTALSTVVKDATSLAGVLRDIFGIVGELNKITGGFAGELLGGVVSAGLLYATISKIKDLGGSLISAAGKNLGVIPTAAGAPAAAGEKAAGENTAASGQAAAEGIQEGGAAVATSLNGAATAIEGAQAGIIDGSVVANQTLNDYIATVQAEANLRSAQFEAALRGEALSFEQINVILGDTATQLLVATGKLEAGLSSLAVAIETGTAQISTAGGVGGVGGAVGGAAKNGAAVGAVAGVEAGGEDLAAGGLLGGLAAGAGDLLLGPAGLILAAGAGLAVYQRIQAQKAKQKADLESFGKTLSQLDDKTLQAVIDGHRDVQDTAGKFFKDIGDSQKRVLTEAERIRRQLGDQTDHLAALQGLNDDIESIRGQGAPGIGPAPLAGLSGTGKQVFDSGSGSFRPEEFRDQLSTAAQGFLDQVNAKVNKDNPVEGTAQASNEFLKILNDANGANVPGSAEVVNKLIDAYSALPLTKTLLEVELGKVDTKKLQTSLNAFGGDDSASDTAGIQNLQANLQNALQGGSTSDVLAAIANINTILDTAKQQGLDKTPAAADAIAKMAASVAVAQSTLVKNQTDLAISIRDATTGTGPESIKADITDLEAELNNPAFTTTKDRLAAVQQIVQLRQQELQLEADAIQDPAAKARFLAQGIALTDADRGVLAQELVAADVTIQTVAAALNADSSGGGDTLVENIVELLKAGNLTIAQATKKAIDKEILQIETIAQYISDVNEADALGKLLADLQAKEAALNSILAGDPSANTKVPKAVTDTGKSGIDATKAAADEARKVDQARLDVAEALAQGDPVAEAEIAQRRADQAARDATDQAGKLEAQAQRIKADRQYQDALIQVFEAHQAILVAAAQAAGDTVAVARLQLQDLLKKIQEPGLKDFEKEGIQSQIVTARQAVVDAQIQSIEDQVNTDLQLKRINLSQAVAQLQAAEQLATNKKERDQIELQIQQLLQQAGGGSFNLPTNINLPTLYEVRRLNQTPTGTSFGGVVDQRVQTVTLYITNGMDQAAAQQFLADSIGKTTTSFGAQNRRY